MSKEIPLSPGVTEFEPGWSAEVKQKRLSNTEPGEVAYHEADHAVAAELVGVGTKDACIMPGPGYLGRTRVGEYNSLVFMAAHSRGRKGTGYDRFVVIMSEDNPDSASSAAASLLAPYEEEIYAVASLLQERGRISGHEVRQAMDSVANPEFNVQITNPLGERWNYVTKVRRGSGFAIPFRITTKEKGNQLNNERKNADQFENDRHRFANKIRALRNYQPKALRPAA